MLVLALTTTLVIVKNLHSFEDSLWFEELFNNFNSFLLIGMSDTEARLFFLVSVDSNDTSHLVCQVVHVSKHLK